MTLCYSTLLLLDGSCNVEEAEEACSGSFESSCCSEIRQNLSSSRFIFCSLIFLFLFMKLWLKFMCVFHMVLIIIIECFMFDVIFVFWCGMYFLILFIFI
jgi:hypothetical protein